MKMLLSFSALISMANAYWLMGAENFITTERLDPIVSPGTISSHVHSGPFDRVLGGSNFRANTNTSFLRQSECTSIPIPQDKSNYWFPHLYFEWKNGSFSSLSGGAVMLIYVDYLFSDQAGTTTAFPDDFRMLSGDLTLRTYDPNSFSQQAITFLCLDFNGVSSRHNGLPTKSCPSGIRAQVNFPSCWDGKNVDSPNHKSHVAFLSEGPDKGSCKDPNYPVVLPRIFLELYWGTNEFEKYRSEAANDTQPFVFSYGDRTGYGYHADFLNGWEPGVLQKAVDNCHCDQYGDPSCCAQQGIFDLNHGQSCRITRSIDEQTTGTLGHLPGNNPVQEEGKTATMFADTSNPSWIYPVYAYTGDSPTQTGQVVSASTPVVSSSTPTSSTTPPQSNSAPSNTVQPTSSSVVVQPSPPPTTSASHTTTRTTSSWIFSTPTISLPTFPSFPSLPGYGYRSVAANSAPSTSKYGGAVNAVQTSTPNSSSHDTCRHRHSRRAASGPRAHHDAGHRLIKRYTF
ncbi:hypothetical protein AMATHDRAFT_143448 [Amanita thiersii Skay4041]|uniref:DUF1996 domain-containing protein n=1 Tax=Amanita thiersii Skay4041 TaxID=703135 RepID=A0A2A9NS31_9AGAR|nr:hypothetical protein AMATHDRAFT_143448 [Amanita thiersii Skay4041]